MHRNSVYLLGAYLIGVLIPLLFSGAAPAVVIPAGLSPGDSYQLAFLTDGARSGDSAQISEYNLFVQSQAALNPSLTGTSEGVDWFAIGSTQSTDARNNAVVGAGVPVYLLDGTTKVADGFTDMWDGDLDNPININQYGATVAGLVSVHTGSKPDGTKSDPTSGGDQLYLGFDGNATVGRQDLATSRWIEDGASGADLDRPFYAVSSLLTVPPIPEPASCLFLLSLAPAALLRRRPPQA